jgi:hypothetical protein
MIYFSCSNYARHRFSPAHLIAWAAIERLLSAKWMKLQLEVDARYGGQTRMNNERRKLLNGPDFTASIVSQVLSICGKIDDETLRRLDEARRKRNAFAHNLVPIKSTDAGKAIRLATDMITEMVGIRVTSQLGFHTWM